MKFTYLNFIATACIAIIQPTRSSAQCSVSIEAAEHILKAAPGNNEVESLSWQLNGNNVYTAYNTGFQVKGVTVAGNRNGGGGGSNQLYGPDDVSVDAAGNVYVLDGYNNRVQKWAPGATEGVTVAGGNGAGSAANQLFFPQGFYVDAAGNVYVADLYNHRIQKWAPGSTSGVTVAGGNGYGSAANQLAFPHDVFVDGSGNIYITDGDNNRVQKWAPGATTGVTVAGGNGFGSGENQLNSPFSLFVDDSGNIYISDRTNSRIQKWAAGASRGVTVAGGSNGSDSTQLNNPRGIYVDAQGAVYIADYFNNRIQKWMPGATYGVTVAGITSNGNTSVQFFSPSGVYLSVTGALFVADEGNNRVQKFASAAHINKSFSPQQKGTYRVIATYKNGCTAISNEIVIDNSLRSTESNSATSNSKAFIVYPNPVKQTATLQFTSALKEKYSITVTDATGKNVLHTSGFSNAGNNILTLDVSNFSNGMYIVNLVTGEKEKKSIKLVKE